MAVTVDVDRCNGNAACLTACAFDAVEVRDGKAVIFDNCTECGACVLACPTHAITSDLFPAATAGNILAIDFTTTSGIAAVVDRLARDADSSADWYTVDASDAAAAADTIAAHIEEAGLRYTVIALPHAGAGPAIAGRVAARTGAHLLAGCASIGTDASGGLRARRLLFGGKAATTSRASHGATLVTLLSRAMKHVAAVALDQPDPAAGAEAPAVAPPPSAMRRAVSINASASPELHSSTAALAQALGADLIDPAAVGPKPLPLDLYVAVGVEGDTEHNALFRNSRTIVAIAENPEAPIAQIADYLLIGDVAEHLNALLTVL